MGSVRATLACVPFAGGGAGFFRAWQKLESAALRIVPVQLPGREELFMQEPLTSVTEAARYLAAETRNLAGSDAPLALFGHSLGAILAFETAHVLVGQGSVDLRHVFVSGSPGPWSPRTRLATGLDDQAFLARVAEFAGYRHEALDDEEMRELLLPLLRADVAMHESYDSAVGRPLPVPVTALRGAADALVTAAETEQWQQATTAQFATVELPGGHMYLVDDASAVLDVVGAALSAAEEGHHA
jgi:surfactin synthase thioesterase subunit